MNFARRVLWSLLGTIVAAAALFAAGVLWPLDELEAVRNGAPFAAASASSTAAAGICCRAPRIAAVIFNGNLYDRAALDRISRHVERRARSWTVGAKIVGRFVKNPGGY